MEITATFNPPPREICETNPAMSGSLPNEWGDEEDAETDDLTAGDVFERLKDEEDVTSADSDEVYRELVDESPEDLVAAADEPTTEPTPEDDDLLADEAALESLLLPDRTEEDGFLWIDPDSAVEPEAATDEGEDAAPSIVDDWMIDFATEADDEAGGTAEEVDDAGEPADEGAAIEGEMPPLPIVDEDPEAIALSNQERDKSEDSARGFAGRIIGRVKRLVRSLF